MDARRPGDWEAMGPYFRATVADFLQAERRVLLGELTQAQTGTAREQRRAWEEEVTLLQASLRRVCSVGRLLPHHTLRRQERGRSNDS